MRNLAITLFLLLVLTLVRQQFFDEEVECQEYENSCEHGAPVPWYFEPDSDGHMEITPELQYDYEEEYMEAEWRTR